MEDYLEYNGRRQTVREWAKEAGMKRNTLRWRIKHGMPVEEALTKPVRDWKAKEMAISTKVRNKMPEGCCIPDCENCPLPDCEYNGIPTKEESAYMRHAHKSLPDWPGGMNHEYPMFTGVRV